MQTFRIVYMKILLAGHTSYIYEPKIPYPRWTQTIKKVGEIYQNKYKLYRLLSTLWTQHLTKQRRNLRTVKYVMVYACFRLSLASPCYAMNSNGFSSFHHFTFPYLNVFETLHSWHQIEIFTFSIVFNCDNKTNRFCNI